MSLSCPVTDATSPFSVGADAPARLAGLLDSAMDAIITIDESQQIVIYNRAAEGIFGWSAAEVVGGRLEKLMPARFRGRHGAMVATFAATGTTTRRMGDNTVLYGQRSDGCEFPLEASISQLDTGDGHLFTVILRDVSERVGAQQELAAFAREAQTLRENEKARVARELHDELAQSLTVLKMDATWLRDYLPDAPPVVAAKIEDMLSLLDGAVASTRRIAADLRPLLLDDLGLVAAIEWLADSFRQRNGVACELSMDSGFDLDEPYATAVFRIVQESLANVAKHAQASRVTVRLRRDSSAVSLEIRDDGVGFPVDAPRKPLSLGLMGLRERAQLLQGTVTIESDAGAGTAIAVRIPIGSLARS